MLELDIFVLDGAGLYLLKLVSDHIFEFGNEVRASCAI